jgi:hypothetical protein
MFELSRSYSTPPVLSGFAHGENCRTRNAFGLSLCSGVLATRDDKKENSRKKEKGEKLKEISPHDGRRVKSNTRKPARPLQLR